MYFLYKNSRLDLKPKHRRNFMAYKVIFLMIVLSQTILLKSFVRLREHAYQKEDLLGGMPGLEVLQLR